MQLGMSGRENIMKRPNPEGTPGNGLSCLLVASSYDCPAGTHHHSYLCAFRIFPVFLFVCFSLVFFFFCSVLLISFLFLRFFFCLFAFLLVLFLLFCSFPLFPLTPFFVCLFAFSLVFFPSFFFSSLSSSFVFFRFFNVSLHFVVSKSLLLLCLLCCIFFHPFTSPCTLSLHFFILPLLLPLLPLPPKHRPSIR